MEFQHTITRLSGQAVAEVLERLAQTTGLPQVIQVAPANAGLPA
jgi:hypothetical protein